MISSAVNQLVRVGEVSYAKPLARALLRDDRLSWGARGLFGFLWDLPENWEPNIKHLAQMGPDGRDAVRARLAELEAVGALRIEAIRVEGGRLAGKRWVLVAPERWAREAPLSGCKVPEAASDGASTEKRVSRSSVKPIIGKHDTKVPQYPEGSPTKPPPPTPSGGNAPNDANGGGGFVEKLSQQDVDDLLHALEAQARGSGKRDPRAWARGALRRIRRTGMGDDDRALLDDWRERSERDAREAASRQAPATFGTMNGKTRESLFSAVGASPPPLLG